jgi:hypothetical protein
MTRRAALRWIGRSAAGLALAGLGVKGIAVERGPEGAEAGARPPGARPGHAGPTAAGAAEGAPHAAVQVFRSRPDLRPPAILVDVPPSPDASPGLVVTDCHFGPGQQGPMLIDGEGNLVWFVPLSPPDSTALRAFNVRVQQYHGPVLTWFEGAVLNGHGLGDYVLYDTRYRPVTRVSAQNGYQGDLHEFLLTDEGTALFTCYGQRPADLSRYGGPPNGSYYYGVVQEVEVATGKLLFEWRSDQHVPLEESYKPVSRTPEVPWDYFHVNSICVDPTDGNLIVSARNTWAVYKLHRHTGTVIWRMGGKASDIQMGPNTGFAFQHDVTLWPGGVLTIFDNEAGPPVEASQSRGLVLALDQAARKATFLTQYLHRPPVLADALGSVQDLPDGHRFMGWGTSSYFTEYDRSHRVLFDARLAPGTQSYRAFRQAWTGRPAQPPDIAVERGPSGTTVYASWNGATEVAQWAVLGGDHPSALRVLAQARRTGFETAIALPHPPPVLAVVALDRDGRRLGGTRPRTV